LKTPIFGGTGFVGIKIGSARRISLGAELA
jgi:hypothetical protein